jgi:dodecin
MAGVLIFRNPLGTVALPAHMKRESSGASAMSKHVYKKLELVGSSPDGVEDAINNAIARCGESVRNLRWFEVTQVRGEIAEGKVTHYQVTMKIGFTLEE